MRTNVSEVLAFETQSQVRWWRSKFVESERLNIRLALPFKALFILPLHFYNFFLQKSLSNS